MSFVFDFTQRQDSNFVTICESEFYGGKNMQKIIDKLSEEQKKELINALSTVDQMFEDTADDDDDYHGTEFYDGLYELMMMLGQWC